MASATIRPSRQLTRVAAPIAGAVESAVRDEAQRAHPAESAMRFVGTIPFGAGMQNESSFRNVEDKKANHKDKEDHADVPTLRASRIYRLGQEIEECGAEKHSRSRPQQQMSALPAMYG